MNLPQRLVLSLSVILLAGAAHGAPVRIDFTSAVNHVEGSYAGGIPLGLTITGTFIIDLDTANAGPASDPNPSYEVGHEYSSFWEFPGAPYGGDLYAPELGAGFSNEAPVSVVINDNLAIDAEQTGGLVATGTYDWIELLASNTIDFCNPVCLPASGEEWSLAIFADTSWMNAGDQIPGQVPGAYTAFLIGLEFDDQGNEIGLALAPVSALSVSAVPVPAPVLLLGSALLGLGLRRRR